MQLLKFHPNVATKLCCPVASPIFKAEMTEVTQLRAGRGWRALALVLGLVLSDALVTHW